MTPPRSDTDLDTPAPGPLQGLPPSREKGSGPVLMSVLAGMLICAAGGGAWFWWWGPVPPSSPPPGDNAPQPTQVFFFDLPDMIVNLAPVEGATRRNFLKLKIVLELGRSEDSAALEKIRPRLVDQIQTGLREFTINDLEGAQGLMRLREQLLVRIQTVTAPVAVRQILFRDILVQ